MKILRSTPAKSKAQAIVEFAIVLPILLLVVYGLIETGRLLFIYSSVNNATRQAARYGSTSGIGPNGVPRYQDCAGIRAAAQNGDYLNAFDDADITITYDHGPGTSSFDTCNGTTDTGVNAVTEDRVVVTVNADYNTIVPKIVPFLSRTVAGGNPITAVSSRTLLLTISIPPLATATYTPTPTFTPTPSFTPSSTSTPSDTPTVTPTLQFTYTPSNTPTITATATRTSTSTATQPAATSVIGCNTTNVTVGLLQQSGNSMIMTINNSLSAFLEISNVTVTWNHDRGHQTGGDKSLILQSASLAGVTFWTGSQTGPTVTLTPTTPAFIPPGTSTIAFTFHQVFDRWDNTEQVTINLSTPGCEGVILFQNQH